MANNFTEETLLFWEYAEDYWRAHPFSPLSLASSSSSSSSRRGGGSVEMSARAMTARENLSVLERQDAVMLSAATTVKQWAESIFLTFVHGNAPYLIGTCNARDMARIDEALGSSLPSGEMPPYNLFRSVQLATFNFMKLHCYPDFVTHPQYHKVLVAAVHAADRVSAIIIFRSLF